MSINEREELIRMLAEQDRELKALRARNNELEANLTAAPHTHTHHPENAVSPLVLSPSSMPPSEAIVENNLKKEIQLLNKTEDDLIAQLHRKDQQIEFLEQNVALYKKKLKQTEELLYELQWDPSQDMAAFHINDRKATDARLEKKIGELIEQMRVMEKGLREKQQIIDELQGENANLVESPEVDQGLLTPVTASPALKSVVIAGSDGIPRTSLSGSTGLRNSQSHLRRRGSATASHHLGGSSSSSSPSWLSFIPFFGDKSPPSHNL